ncbi:VanZ like family protein [Flavobacterium psychrophilum DSM 3660]|nr:VanZ family protein [Flavobacterium psychrophilum]AIN74134.1 teicoplanin resistance protein VanZ [Flavobacterium psychrophilum FPG3]SCX83773.1 VanZ like family protein [Flavobacterium psychrophilum DSM 3660] [Flavobacterium psychrophilum DSM 3660 = ATCC 49418]
MTIKTLLAPNKNSIWIAFFWTFLILYLSLRSVTNMPKITFSNADKIVHFTFYLGFVILWYRYLVFKEKVLLSNKIVLVLISITFGIAIEFAQKYFTTTRQADILDVLANSAGTLAGIFVATRIFQKNKKSEVFDK